MDVKWLPAALYHPVNENATPEFVNLDDRFKCSVCRNILRDPVQSVATGCVVELFRECEPVTSPNADEFCEKLYISDIYPDLSAQREIRSLPVYCPNKNFGCEKAVPWKDLAGPPKEPKGRFLDRR